MYKSQEKHRSAMCNLSQGNRKGYTLEQIAECVEKTIGVMQNDSIDD